MVVAPAAINSRRIPSLAAVRPLRHVEHFFHGGCPDHDPTIGQRKSELRLSRGKEQLERLTPDIREVNDRLFASLDRSDFVCLTRIARELVKDSKRALEFLSLAAPERTNRSAESRVHRRLWL